MTSLAQHAVDNVNRWCNSIERMFLVKKKKPERKKNPAAVALGKLSAKKHTYEQMRERGLKGMSARWGKNYTVDKS